jgi:hypothetical protein
MRIVSRDDRDYEGWSNWVTWNVALWIDNTERWYTTVRKGRPYTAREIRALVKHLMPHGTADMREDGETYAHVDWQELADHFNAS